MTTEIINQVKEYNNRITNLRGYLDLDLKENQLKELEKETTADGFWDDKKAVKKVYDQINKLKEWIESWNKCKGILEEIEVILELAEESDDGELKSELDDNLSSLEKSLKALEFKRMLGGDNDSKNAILTIHPGAGGTESQDWAEMLMRLFLRYAERKSFKTDILDHQSGDEAGIKSVSIEVTGNYAYGYLKAEAGVHRLVRISPFDSNKRRHTSFASVFVLPEVDEDVDIEINPADLRIDTYRASGAGGQHVNKTDSAIRITHLPTNIVVQCQNDRSQHKNKASALKFLKARLFQKQLEDKKKEMQDIEEGKKDIAWGSQIRSYVFHPYNMVKDHRTNIETSNVQNVMDGDIDDFIEAYLVNFGDS
ncbi:MAG: peptide chain release factor 2 [Calditrichaeota bacterium]|nr:peptide chain release factor 2 [Calditrichota bacterium]